MRIRRVIEVLLGFPGYGSGYGGEQVAGVVVVGVGEHLAGGALLDDPAVVHDRDVGRDVADHREVVGDEEHRQAELALELADQVEHRALDRDVERRGDLVGDHDLRAAGEGAGQRDALALAAGELRPAGRRHGRGRGGRARAAGRPRPGARRGSRRAAAPRRCSRRSSSAGRARSTGPGRPSAAGAAGRASAPAARRAGSARRAIGARPTAARARVDLPDPDSPTRPTTCPGGHGQADPVDGGRCSP